MIETLKTYQPAFLTILVAIAAFFTTLKGIYSFTDYLRSRKINYFSTLAEQAELVESLKISIVNTKNVEVFRHLFGYTASAEMIEGCCQLYNQGKLSLYEMKICFTFFSLENHKIQIKLSCFNLVMASLSGLMLG